MEYWDGKVVLVTGAASGIGRSTALRFAHEDASIALLDRNEGGLRQTAEKIGKPSSALLLPVDLQDEAGVLAAVNKAAQWKQRLDVVVNVAGVCPPEDFLESTREYWDTLIQINLRGTYLVAREGARHMIPNGGGAIVNVSSIVALVGDGALVTYCATKGGVSAMTRAMALTLAPHHIRVNAVCPGSVNSPMTEAWFQQMKDPEAARAKLTKAYPLGHIVEPADVAGLIFFLAGPDARCITGANIAVDCGTTACLVETAILSEP